MTLMINQVFQNSFGCSPPLNHLKPKHLKVQEVANGGVVLLHFSELCWILELFETMTSIGVGGNSTNDLSEPLWILSSIKPFESKASECSGGNGVVDVLQFSELCWTTPSFELFTSGVGGNGINDLSSFSELF